MNSTPARIRVALSILLACMTLWACGGGSDNDDSNDSPTNLSPTAVIDTPAIDGLNISLDASLSTDPEGDALTCAWDFGDGSSDNGEMVSHTYAAAGSYQVSLTITDEAQNSDQALRTINVSDTSNPPPTAQECQEWQTRHPEWIFCDDFENDDPLVADGRYFEYGDNDGEFVVADGAGTNASRGMRALWQPGEVGAGGMKLAFGRNPSAYMDSGIRNTEDFTEVYYRIYLKMQSGWQGNPAKLSRATIIAASDWSQAMIAHLWGGREDVLAIDPVRCVDSNDQAKCRRYNDFSNMDWIGLQHGATPIFSAAYDDQWHCIEAHVKLNSGDQENGIQEYWIDGRLEARDDTLNFVRGYTEYGINAIFFENYWNSGSPQLQERYFDNIVVSTQPIGCMDPAR